MKNKIEKGDSLKVKFSNINYDMDDGFYYNWISSDLCIKI